VEPANAEHLLKRGISGAGVVLYPDKT
jgi:hypothetical protein